MPKFLEEYNLSEDIEISVEQDRIKQKIITFLDTTNVYKKRKEITFLITYYPEMKEFYTKNFFTIKNDTNAFGISIRLYYRKRLFDYSKEFKVAKENIYRKILDMLVYDKLYPKFSLEFVFDRNRGFFIKC